MKRDLFPFQKRPIAILKETYICQNRTQTTDTDQNRLIHMSKETYIYVKRDLHLCEKRPLCMSQVTYIYVKSDLYLFQKRPISMSKQNTDNRYQRAKTDSYICQKRPIFMSKETYIYASRSLYICVKRVRYLYSKRPIFSLYSKRPTLMSYICVKSDLYLCQRDLYQKRPISIFRETYPKRPISMAAETFIYVYMYM